MGDAYVGEIRWLPYSRATPPVGWLFCDGSQQPISTYELLYTLVGTIYGGNGVTTFGLPDLRGRVPLHFGTGTGLSARPQGSASGTETVTLTTAQMPAHTHIIIATSANATSAAPVAGGTCAAVVSSDTFYTSGNGNDPVATLDTRSISIAGSSFPHENCAPTLSINAYICFNGLFPSQP